MAQPVKRIVVIGGGTAGEATVPTRTTTFEFLGMREEEWMPKCNASFKLSARFDKLA